MVFEYVFDIFEVKKVLCYVVLLRWRERGLRNEIYREEKIRKKRGAHGLGCD